MPGLPFHPMPDRSSLTPKYQVFRLEKSYSLYQSPHSAIRNLLLAPISFSLRRKHFLHLGSKTSQRLALSRHPTTHLVLPHSTLRLRRSLPGFKRGAERYFGSPCTDAFAFPAHVFYGFLFPMVSLGDQFCHESTVLSTPCKRSHPRSWAVVLSGYCVGLITYPIWLWTALESLHTVSGFYSCGSAVTAAFSYPPPPGKDFGVGLKHDASQSPLRLGSESQFPALFLRSLATFLDSIRQKYEVRTAYAGGCVRLRCELLPAGALVYACRMCAPERSKLKTQVIKRRQVNPRLVRRDHLHCRKWTQAVLHIALIESSDP